MSRCITAIYYVGVQSVPVKKDYINLTVTF